MASGTTDEASRERQTVIERSLGLSLRVPAIDTRVAHAAGEVAAFDDAPAVLSAPAPEETRLVVQADGTGVPMGQPSPATRPGRVGKGQPRGQQKAAMVTGLSTSAPSQRTPQEVVAARLREPGRPETSARPAPVDKARQATLAGQAGAMTRRVPRGTPRAGLPIQHRVALRDGAEALQPQVQTHLLAPTLVLEIIQATASRWDTANIWLGDTHPPRTAWARSDLEPLVAGQTDAVITALAAEANDPMGTGVIEGAWGHWVKERMEPSGMRWTTAGAHAVLDLRAVRINRPWEREWPVHRQPQHRRVYGNAAPVPDHMAAR